MPGWRPERGLSFSDGPAVLELGELSSRGVIFLIVADERYG
jgi:hypothetical protein